MIALARKEFRRILLIKPSSPGDIIHALPVLRGLRRRYPNAHVAWLVATSFVNLLEAEPALDEIIPFDRKRFGRIGRSLSITSDFVRFLVDLRKRRFDLVVDLQGLFRSGFMALASGARVRIGMRATREFAWMFYNHRIPLMPADTHAADKNYALAELLGFEESELDIRIALTDDDRRAATELLDAVGIGDAPTVSKHESGDVNHGPRISPSGRGFAVLVPATRWETKRWPPDRFGRLAQQIHGRHGMHSVLVGGSSDVDIGNQAAAASAGTAANLCGKTTLRELAALIEKAAVVITADSTPMHMAAAQGIPLVALFGPTNPSRTGPYRRLGDVVRLDLPCSPCYFRKLSQCPHNHICMKDLGVEKILTEVNLRLAAGTESAARLSPLRGISPAHLVHPGP